MWGWNDAVELCVRAWGRERMVKLLVKMGGTGVNWRDAWGHTPLTGRLRITRRGGVVGVFGGEGGGCQ